jgi:hypothetical protein
MDEPGVGGSAQVVEAAGAGGAAGSTGMAGSAGSGGNAGSTGDPDGGLPPEPTSTCTDQLQNGDETGIDCGGSCAACQKPCDCAATAALAPLGCELSSSFGNVTGYARVPQLASTGDRVTFDLCYDDYRCRIFQVSPSAGARAIPVGSAGAYLAGASPDGSLILYSPQLSLARATLIDLEDYTTSTGLLAEPALLAANGTAVGLSPTSASTTLARKTPGGELEELGSLPFALNRVLLKGVSPDGSTIVGYGITEDNVQRPFRWTQAGGLVLDLPDLPQNADQASVNAVSSDGNVFAGLALQGSSAVALYRWSAAGGFSQAALPLDFIEPGLDRTIMALSADGSALTGLMALSGSVEFGAFRWTEATGAVAITPGVESMGTLLSGDGSVLIGNTLDSSEYGIFVWTAAQGARPLRTTLESAGVDLRGWQISSPSAISADGRIMVGGGVCGGTRTMYRMVLPE